MQVCNRTFDRTCLRTWNLACAIARLIVMLARVIFSLVLGILQVCGHAHVRSSVSLDIDCILMAEKMKKRAESRKRPSLPPAATT